MKFIKELITSKNWSGSRSDEAFGEDTLRRDLEEGNFESPLVSRKSHRDMNPVEPASAETPDFEDEFGDFDVDFDADADNLMETVQAESAAEETVASLADQESLASAEDDDTEAFDIAFEEDDDLEPEAWNIGLDEGEPEEDQPATLVMSPSEEDHSDSQEDFDLFEDPLFQDEEHAAEIESAAIEAINSKEELSDDDKAALLDEIRLAMDAVRHIRSEEEVDRRLAAREQMEQIAGAFQSDRILDETNSMMDEDATTRRRQAVALMKAAAAATRTDPKLQAMVGRDPSGDPKAQSDYRDDLASFEKPRLETSKPKEPEMDEAPDAGLFAEAEISDKTYEDTLPEDDIGAEEPLFEDHSDLAEAEPNLDMMEDAQDAEPVPEAVDEQPAAAMEAAPATPPAANKIEELRQALTAARPTPPERDAQNEPGGEDAPQAEAIWDIEAIQAPSAGTGPARTSVTEMPQPGAGRQAGRVKTRLLGFRGDLDDGDPFNSENGSAATGSTLFPVGWLVITGGHGIGRSFGLSNGVSQIGRGEGQTIRIDFGDNAISRENHAAIAYDEEQNEFFLGHGGKSNLVRLNGRPVLSTEPLTSGDLVRIGETTLRFVAFCDEQFNWQAGGEEPAGRAAIA